MGDKRRTAYKLHLIFFIDMFHGSLFFAVFCWFFFFKRISERLNFHNCSLRKKIPRINKKKDEIEFH